VLFSDSLDLARMPKQSRLLTVEDDEGRRKYVSAYLMQLHVGGTYRDVDVYVTAIGYKGLAVVGLLPTAAFDSLYISNSGGFVIFQLKRNLRSPLGESVAATDPGDRECLLRSDAPDFSRMHAK
jgi:hypothetical protein